MSFSRRDAAKLIGLSGALAGMPRAALAAAPVERPFPKGFKWGSATSSYQIEGATKEDGRGESIWDVFSRQPGATKNGATGDVAADSYHRYAEDTQLLKNLGADMYRLSFAWPRIFPTGRGKVNRKGLDHYHRVIDNLLENGIEPYITLYHWDLPTALPGGWQSRDTAKAFAEYAALVSREFSDRVQHYMTLNEIRAFIEAGYRVGLHAPGLKLPAAALNQTRHNALLAHGLGVQAIRANAKKPVFIGLAENPTTGVPIIEDDAHVEAARKFFRADNAQYLVAILDGRYPDEWLASQGADAPKVGRNDMKVIGTKLDFVGANIYTGVYVQPADNAAGFEVVPGGAAYPHMGLRWLKLVPEATYWVIRMLGDLWPSMPTYISENGTPAADQLQNGRVGDAERVMYLRNSIGHLQRAAAEGYPVKGYFQWTLIDNFEWTEGYESRFGIHYVDYATQRRIPKLSARYLKEVIARNAVV